METMIGKVESKAWKSSRDGAKTWLSVVVNGTDLSAWPPLSDDMNRVSVGQNVEVQFDTKEFKGKTYRTVKSWAIQGDNVPATTPPPQSANVPPQSYHKTDAGKSWGKSPEERMSILVQSANHDATALLGPYIEKAIAEAGAQFFLDNWENIVKAHSNLSAAIVDASIDYLESVGKRGQS